jgi:hypothetical protein
MLGVLRMNREWIIREETDLGEDGELLVLTSIGVAALLGLSRQRVSQLLEAGQLPEPRVSVNGIKHGWLPSQFIPEGETSEQISDAKLSMPED